MPRYDVSELVQRYALPPLPEVRDSVEPRRRLVLFRCDAPGVVLTGAITLADAIQYTNREDTHGNGWFVGFAAIKVTLPGDEY